MRRWLLEQLSADPPPRRVKKCPSYKFPTLLGKLVNGQPGSAEFWEEFPVNHDWTRGGKRCERCERCSCKDFPTGVKFLVKNVIKGGVENFSPKLYSKNVIKGCVKTPGNHKCL